MMRMVPPQQPSGPEPLGEVLARLFASRGLGAQQWQLQLEQAWREVAGTRWAEATRLGTLRRGVLEVLVRDASVFHELVQFHQGQWLAGLQARLGPERVRKERFRLAAW